MLGIDEVRKKRSKTKKKLKKVKKILKKPTPYKMYGAPGCYSQYLYVGKCARTRKVND